MLIIGLSGRVWQGMRFVFLWVAVSALSVFLGSFAGTAKAQTDEPLRVGIVVSNQTYLGIRPLEIPHSDGDRVETALKDLQFEVVIRLRDARSGDIEAALGEAQDSLQGRTPDIVFFYFSGHGGVIEGRGDNFLFATDFEPRSTGSLQTAASKLSDIIDTINAWQPDAILMAIDACRDLVSVPAGARSNSPLPTADYAQPAFGRGLVRQSVANAPLFVSFATRPGEIALDAPIYSVALSEEMKVRGADVATVFGRIRDRVILATGAMQAPHNEDGLTSPVWLQPEFSYDVELYEVAVWPVPPDLYRPRLIMNPAGGGLWVQSGYWGSDHPFRLIAINAAGDETWRADAVSLDFPDTIVFDTATFASDGQFLLGLHTEEESEWTPVIALLNANGQRIKAPQLTGVARSGKARVRRISIDPAGEVWIAINDGPDKAYSFVRASSDLSTMSEFGGTLPQSARHRIFINSLLPFDQATAEENDCMLRPKPCGPLLFAAGAVRQENSNATLLQVSPTGLGAGEPLQASATDFEFSWLGAKGGRCCVLFGATDSGEGSSLIFAEANILGLTNPAYTSFVPTGYQNCMPEGAAQTDSDIVVALATCHTGANFVSTLVLADPALNVIGWAAACEGRSCRASEIVRGRDGRILTAVSGVDGYVVSDVRIRRSKGIPH